MTAFVKWHFLTRIIFLTIDVLFNFYGITMPETKA